MSETGVSLLEIKPGMRIGDFTVDRRLGAGGMGEVWLARQESMDREIALKILFPQYTDNTDFVQRFQHEIKMAGKLQHPNIVTAYHAGVDQGLYYLAVAYIDGVELSDRLEIDKCIPEKEAITIVKSIAQALKYAWNKFQILHRDIKPGNIIINSDGVPKLMDMGISKSLKEDFSLTLTGMIVGTPFYISPEQAKGDQNIDCRSDMYSLGVTLYHMVTGVVPYDGPTAMAIIAKHITQPFPHPQERNPDVSDYCSALLERMMGKKPEDRQQTWEQVIDDFDRVLADQMPLQGVLEPGKSTIIKTEKNPTRTVKMPEKFRQEKSFSSESEKPKSSAETDVNLKKVDPGKKKLEIKFKDPQQAEQPTGKVVGIDLGTTYSVVAWLNESGHVEIIPNSDGYATTPSVVFVDGNDILVGREAVRASLLEPELSADCFKRDMGLANFHHTIASKKFRPEVLSAFVLKKLKQDAEDKIGPIAEAVVTVPAYFDDTRRKATIDAGKIAGLKISTIINEPSAAALWYAFSSPQPFKSGSIFLVYDLGGGTFDATLMKVVSPDRFETLATDGDVMLGGKDWDKRLVDYVSDEFLKSEGCDPREDEAIMQELTHHIEDAKKTLCKRNSVTIPVSYQGKRLKVPVTREKFEELTIDLLKRTQTTVELLLVDAGLEWEDIDKIIAVGGSSRMTMVEEMLRATSGKEIDTILDADLAIAQGAAVCGASIRAKSSSDMSIYEAMVNKKLQEMSHSNVNSHSLGIEVASEVPDQSENYIMIRKNTPLPCEQSAEFGLATSSSSEQCKLKVKVLEGESRNPEACIHVGTCVIDNLPPGLPEGSPVVVTFSYSEEGRISVKALAQEAGIEASATIESSSGLDHEMLQKQVEAIKSMSIS